MAIFAAFERHQERRGAEPLVPPHLFADRGFTAGILAQGLFFGSMTGFFFILTLLLQTGWHLTAFDAGLVLTPFAVGSLIGSSVSGTFGMAQQVGAALGIAVVCAIFLDRTGAYTTGQLTSAFQVAAVAALIGYGITVVAGCCLPRTPGAPSSARPAASPTMEEPARR